MNRVKTYTPNFMDVEPEILEFETIEDLKKMKFLTNWLNDKDFHRLSIGKNGGTGPFELHLMVEQDEGYRWFVVGFLENDIPELPSFESKRREESV